MIVLFRSPKSGISILTYLFYFLFVINSLLHLLFEKTGDGKHSCVGKQLVPPRMCDRAVDPTCTNWLELGPSLAEDMGNRASFMLDAWKPQQDHVTADDKGMRKTSEWPVLQDFPCCKNNEKSNVCGCDIDVPPKKGQAPRAKPKSGVRATYADKMLPKRYPKK